MEKGRCSNSTSFAHRNGPCLLGEKSSVGLLPPLNAGHLVTSPSWSGRAPVTWLWIEVYCEKSTRFGITSGNRWTPLFVHLHDQNAIFPHSRLSARLQRATLPVCVPGQPAPTPTGSSRLLQRDVSRFARSVTLYRC